MKDIPYLAAVGSLNYLDIGTRPNLAHAVGELGQFNSNPGLGCWKAVQYVLKYLKGTANLGLTYCSSILIPRACCRPTVMPTMPEMKTGDGQPLVMPSSLVEL